MSDRCDRDRVTAIELASECCVSGVGDYHNAINCAAGDEQTVIGPLSLATPERNPMNDEDYMCRYVELDDATMRRLVTDVLPEDVIRNRYVAELLPRDRKWVVALEPDAVALGARRA